MSAADKRLAWCDTHDEPVWVWSGGLVQCPYDLITETNNDHALDLSWTGGHVTEVSGVEWCEVHQSTRHERFHECWALYAGATADGAKPCRFVPLYIKEAGGV